MRTATLIVADAARARLFLGVNSEARRPGSSRTSALYAVRGRTTQSLREGVARKDCQRNDGPFFELDQSLLERAHEPQ